MEQERHDGPAWLDRDAPVANIVIYIPKPGKEADLLALVRLHEPALRDAGLVTGDRFQLWRAWDVRKQREQYVEHFVWKNGQASAAAHRTPQVTAVWDPMIPLLEAMAICEVEPI